MSSTDSQQDEKGNSKGNSDNDSIEKEKNGGIHNASTPGVISSDEDEIVENSGDDRENSIIEKNIGAENAHNDVNVSVTIPEDSVVVLMDGDDNYEIYTKIDYASKLVSDWGFDNELVEYFKDKLIDVDALKFMTFADVDLLIPVEKLGIRIKFKQKWMEWKIHNKYSIPLAETSTSENLKPSTTGSTTTTASMNLPSANLVTPLPCQSSSASLNLNDLLNRSVLGKSLIKKYLKENKLEYDDRNNLCTVIAEYWVETKQQVISSTYMNAFMEIKKNFPTEEQEYYISLTKEVGKLNRRYYSLSRKYQQKGFVESRYNLKRKFSKVDKPIISIDNDALHTPTKYETESAEWLKYNKTPEPTVYKKWGETYKLRRKQIDESNAKLYDNWPLLKQNIGASLIELDFDILYPEKDLLSVKFDKFSNDIISYYQSNIKDESSLKLLNDLPKVKNINSIDYILINLLPSVLVPHIIHYMENDKRRSWKPTILDSQNFIVLRVETKNYIRERVQLHRNNLKKRGLTNQPFIVAVGSVSNLHHFYVSVDDFFYKADSFKKALAITYKVFHVLNIQYPNGAKQIWEFIQSFFFETPLKGKKTSQLMALLSAFK